jgi:hypothetical protein
MNRPAGERGRVSARVYFRRAGSRKTRHKTVSRRFVMCGSGAAQLLAPKSAVKVAPTPLSFGTPRRMPMPTSR